MKNLKITVNGVSYDVQVEEVGQTPSDSVPAAAAPAAPAVQAPAPAVKSAQGSVSVSAPMPGTVLSVKVKPGQKVTKGETLVVLEAMKMENEIPSPSDGTVASVDVAAGSTVETGAVLVTLE